MKGSYKNVKCVVRPTFLHSRKGQGGVWWRKTGRRVANETKNGERNSWGGPVSLRRHDVAHDLECSRCSSDNHCFILSSSRGLSKYIQGLFFYGDTFLPPSLPPSLSLPPFFDLFSVPSSFLLCSFSLFLPFLPVSLPSCLTSSLPSCLCQISF